MPRPALKRKFHKPTQIYLRLPPRFTKPRSQKRILLIASKLACLSIQIYNDLLVGTIRTHVRKASSFHRGVVPTSRNLGRVVFEEWFYRWRLVGRLLENIAKSSTTLNFCITRHLRIVDGLLWRDLSRADRCYVGACPGEGRVEDLLGMR